MRVASMHALGWSHTIGDPYGKADNTQQLGPSCGVGAQYGALHASGDRVHLWQLAKEAYDYGDYVEYKVPGGRLDGGISSVIKMNALLNRHKVESYSVEGATLQQLNGAVFSDGDAIVGVRASPFYKDATIDANSAHAIYLTGAEVDRNGTVIGYYFNDTGTGEGARYVSSVDFQAAWLHALVVLHKKTK